jgi:hypothetical protein
MKKNWILLILLFASACSFQVNVLQPQSTETVLQPSPVAISTSTLSVITPTSTVTPLPSPTVTLSPLPPIITGPSNSSAVVPIVFAPNATSQMVIGNIPGGSSQTYSLNAFEGQIMSVSILPEKAEQQNSYQLEIHGRDGTILCPIKDDACFFWRGALPSTQEYRIKVSAPDGGGGAFSMRVAIDPPGTMSQLFSYTDPQGRFSLSYPDDYAPAHFPGAQVTKISPDFVLQYIDTQQYISTNLGEVYFLLGVSDDPQQVSVCTQPLNFDQPETELGDTTINGIDFKKSQGGGVGAGNIYEQVYYRTLHNGSCYEVTYFVHYSNIGNYTPGTVTEFDRTALYQQLDEILASLILK